VRDRGQKDKAELEELRQLRQREDWTKNPRIRAWTAFGVGTGWLVWNLALGWFHRSGLLPLSHALLLVNVTLTMVVFGVVNLLVRRTLLSSVVDRRVVLIMWCIFAGTGLLWASGAALGIEPIQSLALTAAFYQFFPTLIVLIVDRSLLVEALLLLPLALGQVVFWEHVFEWQAAFGAAGGALLGWRWWRQGRALERAAVR
jgi:hypothetical protein